MTKKDGKPCEKCDTNEWYDNGKCRECNRTRVKKWQRDNADKHRRKGRKWYEANTNQERERKQRWHVANPDIHRERIQSWRKNNPEKVSSQQHRRRTRKTGAGGSYTAEEFKALCEQYDNRCLACGEKKKLEFDHVIPVSKGGSSDISNGQPLCRSCNSKKGTKTIDYRIKP